MKKTIVTIATITVVGLGSAFFTETIHAETLNDLHNKQTKIQSERSDIKANLSKAEAQIADVLIDLQELNEEITRIEDALKHNQKAMTDTKEEISATDEEIEVIEEEIAVLEEAIEKRYEILKQRAVSFQKNGGNIGYLDVIFGSKTFGEFISRVSAVSKITDSDKELMMKQEEDKAKVEEQQEELENKLSELQDMKVELEGMQVLITDQKEQTVQKRNDLKKKQEELNTLKTDLQIKDSNLASIEAQVKRSIEAARTPVVVNNSLSSAPSSASSSSNGGKLTTLSSAKENGKKQSSAAAPAATPAAAPAAKGNISTAINAGYGYLGVPYRSAGKTTSGFDCSGFVSWAFAQAGYSIPSSTAALQSVGTKVSYSNIQPGDLVFFNTYKTNGHVGIYVGGGNFIGSQNSTGLAVANMTSGYWKDKFAGHVRRIR